MALTDIFKVLLHALHHAFLEIFTGDQLMVHACRIWQSICEVTITITTVQLMKVFGLKHLVLNNSFAVICSTICLLINSNTHAAMNLYSILVYRH